MPERSDISLRGLAIGVVIVVGAILAALGVSWFISGQVDVPGPQTAPAQDLASFLREKNERLQTGGPIEGQPNRVRIPIEQAMRIVAERSRR